MYKILVIGAGPGGISMGVEATNLGIKRNEILILEKAEEHSFTIKKYYHDKKLVTANYKGFISKCTGVMCLSDTTKPETITYLDKAIEDNGLSVNYNETVYKIEKHNEENYFTVITDKGEYNSKVVAVAVGILGKPNKPDYQISTKQKDRVLYDLTTKEISNSKILVVGGGDSASEYCQFLSNDKTNEVFLSYRKKELSRMNNINHESLLALAGHGKTKLLLESNITSVLPEYDKLTVSFSENKYNDKRFDYIVYALGGSTPENFLKTIGIEFNGPNPILKPGYETSVPGLFLLGDLSAGKKGGSINWAFNSANTAIKKICNYYLKCNA